MKNISREDWRYMREFMARREQDFDRAARIKKEVKLEMLRAKKSGELISPRDLSYANTFAYCVDKALKAIRLEKEQAEAKNHLTEVPT